MTTEDYLNQLEQDREDLVDNLETKGITGLTGDETFTELVPEVLNIPSGGGADLRDYFQSTIESGGSLQPGVLKLIKTIPSNTLCGTSLAFTFNYCINLETFPLLDTSNVTTMQGMFSNCSSLTEIPLLNTENVTSMQAMLNGCSGLTTIPQLNTSNVTTMQNMFTNCTNLTTIPQLNTSKVTSMQGMFTNCSSLTEIPQLNASKVTTISSMFSGCSSLTEIPQLDTSSVLNFYQSFKDCTNLTTIPQLDTSKATNLNDTFANCPSFNTTTLNNILNMCINATSYKGTKTLKTLGFTSTNYSSTILKRLSNYSAFTSAGWTIGY